MILNTNTLMVVSKSVAAIIQGKSRLLTCTVKECQMKKISPDKYFVRLTWETALPGDDMVQCVSANFSDQYLEMVQQTVFNQLSTLGISGSVNFNNTGTCFFLSSIVDTGKQSKKEKKPRINREIYREELEDLSPHELDCQVRNVLVHGDPSQTALKKYTKADINRRIATMTEEQKTEVLVSAYEKLDCPIDNSHI